ncbi:MAG: hypothetical protein RL358_651 [Pseudomonadota bacterium]|jgi:flagellar protein FliS
MNAITAISAYNKVGIESNATAANPHKLISMLFQGALLAVANAKNGLLRNDIPAKGKAISHAIAIIGEGLHASLDKTIGGEMVQNLAALYDYMTVRLVAANLNNDIAALDEVTRLLIELKEAWESIRPNATPAAAPARSTVNAALVYARG